MIGRSRPRALSAAPEPGIPAGQDPLPGLETPHELQPAGRFEWERVIYRVTSESMSWRFTMLVLAGHADPDGTRVRPGVLLLMDITRASERTVKRHLKRARDLGFLDVVHRGGGRSGAATEYRLTIPTDLFDLVDLLPVQRPADAPPDAPAKPRYRRTTRRETEATQMASVPDDTPGNRGHVGGLSSDPATTGTQATQVASVRGTQAIDPPATCGDVTPPTTKKRDHPVRDKVSTSPAPPTHAADPQNRPLFGPDRQPPPAGWRPPRRHPTPPATDPEPTPPRASTRASTPPEPPPPPHPTLTLAETA